MADEPTLTRRFYLTMAIYLVLGVLAWFTFEDELLLAVLFFLLVLGIKTYIVVLQRRLD